MERLTEKTCSYSWVKDKQFQDFAVRLQRYEDLEEQGLLARLPCRVGQKIFVLTTDSPTGLEETKVIQIKLFVNSLRVICKCVYDDWANAKWEFKPQDFGTRVFLTKAEAEQALEEMEGE